MKRIKSINGYTIYQASERDESRYNVEADYFYLYFSSDIRDFGIAYSDIEMECGSMEEAEAWATGSNYAAAREYVEANTTAAEYADIEAVEKLLDAGLTVDDIAAEEEAAAEDAESVQAVKGERLFYALTISGSHEHYHGPYFSMEAADAAARNYAENTGAEYLPPVNN